MKSWWIWIFVVLMSLVAGNPAAAANLTGSWFTNTSNWTTDDRFPWTVQTTVTFDGGDALETGPITNNTSTYAETTAVGPAILRFQWKVSSQPSVDTLQFATNGVQLFSISGEVEWQERAVLLASGTNTLRWTYAKNLLTTDGQDKGWLDAVRVGPIEEPVVLTHPSSVSTIERGYATFSGTITGATPLSLQWRFDGIDIPGATNASLSLTNVTLGQAGSYALFGSNSFGTVISTNRPLSITPLKDSPVMSLLWKKLPGSTLWLENTNTSGYRGLAYNPITDHLLVVSRLAGTNIWVLNGTTGQELYPLTLTTNVTGGTFTLNMVGVDDDGAVYAGNLTQNSQTNAFRLYRWANDGSNTIPTLAWQGNPGLGDASSIRWGDSMDVRGSGENVKVALGLNSPFEIATFASIITPANGTNSPAQLLSLSGSSGFGLTYVAFGPGETLWFKKNGPLRYVSYAGSPAVIKTYSSLPMLSAGLAVDHARDRVAIIHMENPDTLRLHEIADLTNNPVWLDTEFFQHPLDEANAFSTGSIDITPGRLYAIDCNNGILAMKIAPILDAVPSPNGIFLSWPWGTLQGAENINGSFEDIAGASSPITLPLDSDKRFFRLRY